MKRFLLTVMISLMTMSCFAYYDYDVAEDARETGGLSALFSGIDKLLENVVFPIFWILVAIIVIILVVSWIKEKIEDIFE